MKTVGYVTAEFPVFSDTFIGTEIRAMQARGHRVVTLAMSPAKGPVQPVDLAFEQTTFYLSQVNVFKVMSLALLCILHWGAMLSFVISQRALPRWTLFLQACHLATLVRRHGILHLHAHFALATSSVAIAAAKLTNISVSFTGHGADIYAQARDLPLKLKAADFVVATCEQSRLDLQYMAPEASVIVCHCGVDLRRFVFRPSAAEPNGRFLFVGKFVERKGIDVLLAALTAWPEIRLDLVGDGPLLDEMKALAQRFELVDRVTFRGPQPAEWFIQHAHEYVALVAPYRVAADGDRPTTALVVKESMALGLPVITTDLMGCRDILDEISGWKVKPDDIDALCDTMQDCLHMTTGARMRMIYAARTRIEKLFDANHCAASLSRAIEHLPRTSQKRATPVSGRSLGVDG